MPAPHTTFTPDYRYCVLFLLWVSYIFNFIDRQLMTILLEPIKQEFGASDTAMGLLAGFAFAAALTAMSGYGLGTWSPSFLIRVHGLSLTEAGLMLGLVGSLGGLVGAICGGALCDRLVRRDHRWQLRLPAIGALAASLLSVLMGGLLYWRSVGAYAAEIRARDAVVS